MHYRCVSQAPETGRRGLAAFGRLQAAVSGCFLDAKRATSRPRPPGSFVESRPAVVGRDCEFELQKSGRRRRREPPSGGPTSTVPLTAAVQARTPLPTE